MSSNEVIFSLVILGPLGLIALVQLFSDGVKYGFGEDGSLMTPAQVSVMLKAVGGLFLVALVVVGGIWIYNELNDDKTESIGLFFCVFKIKPDEAFSVETDRIKTSVESSLMSKTELRDRLISKRV